ncbi:MAG: hypothetical protein GXP47_14145, partial [Acidobacteria bacterium]|nr:hypothetical protein [Acidobacteriota bacterium]
LDLQADLNLGPAFFDPHCESGIHACAADLAAAGTGWRALARTGDGRVRIRWSKGDPWAWYDIPLNNIRQLTAGIAMPDRLFVSGDQFSLIILTDPENPSAPLSVTPFTGASGTAFPVSPDHVVVAADDGLQVAVIDLQDPYNPVIATAATTLADGAGRVVDMYLDPANHLWLLSNGPDRLIEVDAAALPTIDILGSWDLPDDGGGARVAMDGGTFHYAPTDADLDSLWVVRRGHGLDLYDRSDIAAGVLSSAPLPGYPRDIWVGECATGIRVLVAAGFDAGVLEVDTSTGGANGSWPVSWVGDLGDVRRLTLAAKAYFNSSPVAESCSDIRDFRENSPIPSPCDARLYALSEAGVLPVPVDICTCGAN